MSLAELDVFIFAAIHGGATAPASAIFVATLIAKLVIYALPLHLALLCLRGGERGRQTALALLLALMFGFCASYLIGQIFYRPRPFLAGIGEELMAHRPSPSFPSNHALIFFAYAWTLLLLRHFRLGSAILIAGLIVAGARIYLGVHYPGDILGGLVLGLASALASLFFWARWGGSAYRSAIRRWRHITPSTPPPP